MGYYKAGGVLGDLMDSVLNQFPTPVPQLKDLAKAKDPTGLMPWAADSTPGGATGGGGGTSRGSGASGKWTGNERNAPGDARPRRMNVGNVHALRRGMRRIQSFARLAHRTIQFTHRTKLRKHRRR